MSLKAALAMAFALAPCTLGPMPALASERANAALECAATPANLVYECTIALSTRARAQPLTGAEVLVKADMPSMPMAHNIPPARAEPTAKPGEYRARLSLDMHGEWLITIDVAGPLRDRVLVKHTFGPAAATGTATPHHQHGAAEPKPSAPGGAGTPAR
jgi:hypothetical protein